MFKLTGKAKEDFSKDLQIPLEKYLESRTDYEVIMAQMMFFDKIVNLEFQHTLKKNLKNYHQGLFSQFIQTIEKANKEYNNSVILDMKI